MTENKVCIIEEWRPDEDDDAKPYKKIQTIAPAFSDMAFAINQVEDLVFIKLNELREASLISELMFATAVSEIPYKWTSQQTDAEDTNIYLHSQPELDYIYTVCQLPVLNIKLSDFKIQ